MSEKDLKRSAKSDEPAELEAEGSNQQDEAAQARAGLLGDADMTRGVKAKAVVEVEGGDLCRLSDAEDKRVSELITQLGSIVPKERETASTELAKFGGRALLKLDDALASPDFETQCAAKYLISKRRAHYNDVVPVGQPLFHQWKDLLEHNTGFDLQDFDYAARAAAQVKAEDVPGQIKELQVLKHISEKGNYALTLTRGSDWSDYYAFQISALQDLSRKDEILADIREVNVGNSRDLNDGQMEYFKHLPNLERVTLSTSQGGLTEESIARVARIGSVKELSVDLKDYSELALAPLRSLPNLTNLSIWGGVSKQHLEQLSNCKSLAQLRIINDITSESLEGLKAIPTLTGLELGNTTIDDAGVAAVSEVKGLQQLEIMNGKFTDAGFANIGNLTNLRSLKIPGDGISDVGLRHFAPLKQLEELHLSSSNIHGDGLKELSGLTNLRHLNIAYAKSISDVFTDHLGSFPKLKSLGLSMTSITDSSVERIGKVTGLEALDLAYDQITDKGLAHLAGLSNLVQLQLSHTKVTDAGMEYLGSLTKLKTLSIEETEITDDGVRAIAEIGSLESLDLSGTKVTDKALEEICKLKNLKTLELSNTSITDEQLERLASLPNLEHLHLYGTKVSDVGMAKLAMIKSLKTLDIGGTSVTPAGAFPLTALEHLQNFYTNITVKPEDVLNFYGFKNLKHLGVSAEFDVAQQLKELLPLTCSLSCR